MLMNKGVLTAHFLVKLGTYACVQKDMKLRVFPFSDPYKK